MRNIIFRGKRVDNGEWVYGDLFHIGRGCLIYFGSQTELEAPDIAKESLIAVEFFKTEIAVVSPDTVGMFTGLTDKNGTKIFEGDILRISISKHGVGYVRWLDERAQFVVNILNSKQWYGIDGVTAEVIGNIHDNGELLL